MSQEIAIHEHLKAGNHLTPLEALRLFNCWSLSSRIADLNRKGAGIHSKLVKANGKQYAEYFLEFPVDKKGQRLLYA